MTKEEQYVEVDHEIRSILSHAIPEQINKQHFDLAVDEVVRFSY